MTQVGLTEQDAAHRGQPVIVARVSYSDGLKPQLTGEPSGRVKILADPTDRRILGGGAAGDRAAEVMAPVAAAIAGKLTLEDLAGCSPAHPSLSELVGVAARAA